MHHQEAAMLPIPRKASLKVVASLNNLGILQEHSHLNHFRHNHTHRNKDTLQLGDIPPNLDTHHSKDTLLLGDTLLNLDTLLSKVTLLLVVFLR